MNIAGKTEEGTPPDLYWKATVQLRDIQIITPDVQSYAYARDSGYARQRGLAWVPLTINYGGGICWKDSVGNIATATIERVL